MKKPRIVVLRGKPTSGKSTAWHSLKKREEMRDWVFVDNADLKDKLGKEIGKASLYAVLKIVMRMGRNIIIEEMSEKSLRKNINYYIKKYGYEIVTFQFEVDLEKAYKRNVQRAKDGWHTYIEKKQLEAYHKMHDEKFDRNGILVDCNKLGKRAVVELILERLK